MTDRHANSKAAATVGRIAIMVARSRWLAVRQRNQSSVETDQVMADHENKLFFRYVELHGKDHLTLIEAAKCLEAVQRRSAYALP